MTSMIDAGYFAKLIEPTPDWLHGQSIREICSVSTCISCGPEDWVDHWRHNELGWFNTIEDAWSVVPEAERHRYRLFAYRMGLIRFRQGEPLEVPVPADVHPAQIPASFVSLGYDAVSRSMETVLGFECSPLSCNSMAEEIPANEFCLFGTEAAATAGAQAFSVQQPEPGDYYVVEVLEAHRP
jgi:hypothetical protein